MSVQKNGTPRIGPLINATPITPAHAIKPTCKIARYRTESANGKMKNAAITK